jgi:hypothetical protein
LATTKTDRRDIARYVGISQCRELCAPKLIEPATAGHQHVHGVGCERVAGGCSGKLRETTETTTTCRLRQTWIKS